MSTWMHHFDWTVKNVDFHVWLISRLRELFVGAKECVTG